jgi:hypothetical protein
MAKSRKSQALQPDMDTQTFSEGKSKSSKQEFEDAKKRLADDLSRFSFDPDYITRQCIEFGKFITCIPLYEYQYKPAYRIIYSVLTIEGAILSMLFSRQSGKSECVAFTVDTLAVLMPTLSKVFPELDQYKAGIKMGLFAPQQDQVNTTYSRCLSRINTDTASLILDDPELDAGLTSDRNLILNNGSYLKGQVAAKTSKIESKTYDLVFMEEAQDLDSFLAQKSIEPMVSATSGTIVKVGTTGTVKNHFWYDIQENKRLSRSQPPELAYHFEYNYKEVIAHKRKQYEIDKKLFHLNYEKDVMKKKQRWGEDSDAFRLGFALIWALDSGMFITDGDWDIMTNKKKGFSIKLEEDDYITAGLDIGKEQNSTVLTITRSFLREPDDDSYTKEILRWFEWRGEDYDTLHYFILDALIEFNVQVLVADYTGVGKPVVDRIMADIGEYVEVIPYTFTRDSKSQMWQNLQGDIRGRRLIVPANKTVAASREFKNFEHQMKGLLKWYDGSYLVCQKGDAPDDRDDYCDSVGMACLAGNQRVAKDMEEVSDNVLYDGLISQLERARKSSW